MENSIKNSMEFVLYNIIGYYKLCFKIFWYNFIFKMVFDIDILM